MTKLGISNKLSKDININKNISKEIVKKLLIIIADNSKNKTVKISNFGTFFTHYAPKRVGRNPKTNESYIISPRKKLNFKHSKKITEILNWN